MSTVLYQNVYYINQKLFQNANLELIATGNKLIPKNSLIGKIHEIFSSKQSFDEIVQDVVQKLNVKIVEVIRPAITNYCKSLNDLIDGFPISQEEMHISREDLQEWECYALPLYQNNLNDFKIIGLDFTWWNDFHHCRNIIALETASAGTIPFDVFKVLALIEEVEYDGEKLKDWKDRFQKISRNLSQPILHDGLISCVAFLKQKYPKRSFSHVKLECLLSGLGFKEILEAPDPKQIIWRDSLKVGDQISKYTLGKVLGFNDSSQDRKKIFFMGDFVFVVPQNRAVLEMRQWGVQQLEQQNREYQILGYQEIDQSGKWGTMEYLPPIIENFEKLVDLIKYFISRQGTPMIDLSLFRYDRNGKVKALKPFNIWKNQKFNKIEKDLIFVPSKGQQTKYTMLSRNSGINKLPAAQFYEELVSLICNSEYLDIDLLAISYEIADRDVIERGKQLSKELEKIINQTLQDVDELNQTRDAVKRQTLYLYQRWCLIGRLIPGFKEELLNLLNTNR